MSSLASLLDLAGSSISGDFPQRPVEIPEVWLLVLLSPWTRLAAFVWGALWGSFANVVIHRVPLGMSIVRPRSRCPQCETPIAGYDNVPILSYLWLRGRCRRCKTPVSLRYPLVELLAGVLSFALFMQHVYVPVLAGQAPNVVGWLVWFVFGVALIALTYIDLDYWIIPDEIVLPLAAIGVLLAFVWPDLLGVSGLEALAAAGFGFGLFAGIRWIYRKWRGIEALGLGDAKLLLMIGAFFGPPGLAWTIGGGALQGVLISIPLVLSGRRVANSDLQELHGDDPELGEDEEHVTGQRVPFGPFLALAALEFLLLGETILETTLWLADRILMWIAF